MSTTTIGVIVCIVILTALLTQSARRFFAGTRSAQSQPQTPEPLALYGFDDIARRRMQNDA
ncbi:MAG: hypothetical protein KBE09_05415 [Candidatus Pacebacteria bacterium]|nr:hypothetical protein [Candidatus Paceibacterota bacterium]